MRFLRSKQNPGRKSRGLTVSSETGRLGKTRKRSTGTARKRAPAQKAGRRRAPALLSRRQTSRLGIALSLLAMLTGTTWLWQSGWFHEQAARVYTNLSECLIELGDTKKADALIEEGITFDPDNMKLYVAMSQVTRGMEDFMKNGSASDSYDLGGQNDVRLPYNK